MKTMSQKSTFALLHTCPTFFGVLRGPNAPSRSSGAVGALFAPKWHKPHFGIRVRRFLMFLELQNAFGRSKRVSEPLLHFGAPKPSRNVGHVWKKKGSTQDWRTFRSKVLLGSTWGTLGPRAGRLAGRLAEAGAEARARAEARAEGGARAETRARARARGRAEGSGLRAQSRGLRAQSRGLRVEG